MKRFLANIIVFSLRLLSKLPMSIHYAFGSFAAFLMRSVFHYRSDVVMINIARSFPELKYKQLKRIYKDFYNHLGEILAETIIFADCTNDRRVRKKRLCTLEFDPAFKAAYKEASNVMILASHCGNWELLAGYKEYVSEQDKDILSDNSLCMVYKKLSSDISDMVFKKLRLAPMKDDFEGYLESKRVLRFALNHRNEKKAYIFATDQFPYKSATRHEVQDFMHQKTYAMTGGAALAAKLHMGVAFMHFDRIARGEYKIRIELICEDASMMTPESIMDRFYEILQIDIQANPANYLWSHKRWK